MLLSSLENVRCFLVQLIECADVPLDLLHPTIHQRRPSQREQMRVIDSSAARLQLTRRASLLAGISGTLLLASLTNAFSELYHVGSRRPVGSVR